MHDSCSKVARIGGLKNGAGIQSLLNEAYEIFGNPILIHDMEYQAREFIKDVVTDDPIWNEYTSNGTVAPHWLDFFKHECFLEAAANAKKITFLTSDKLKYDRIFGKIFNKHNIQIGCAVMLACNKPFEHDDPILFEETCTLFSTELGNNDYYNDYGQAYLEKLVAELIAGIEDIALYTAHVESIYMHLKSKLYLALVDIGKCDPTYAQLAYYRDLFKKAQPEYTYAIYSNYILIILGTDNEALYHEKDLSHLNRLFQESNLYAGISSGFENLFDLNQYFKEALQVLNSSLGIPGQHIFLYDHFVS